MNRCQHNARAARAGTFIAAALLSVSLRAEPLQLSQQLVLADPPLTGDIPAARQLPLLHKGMKGPSVRALSELIAQTGLINFAPNDPAFFGGDHDQAVKALQRHFGLKPDGIAGPVLYTNLEISRSAKREAVEAFALRLENLAHQARSEGRDKMVVINVPSFTLRAIDLLSGQTVVESPVIVGRKDRPTPIGRLNIVGLKVNPTWKPPPVVMKNDILPKLGKDPKWWDKHPLLGVGPDGTTKPGQEVTPEEVEAGWKFLQEAGKSNALGRLKFETDSAENIYLHDTSERGLFANVNRTHSSGCVRVQKWQALAAFLSGQPIEKITEVIEEKETRSVRIGKIVPVFVEYSLGDVVDGKALYFPDIYARTSAPVLAADKPPEQLEFPLQKVSTTPVQR